MVIDADIHVTTDTMENLRSRLPERYQRRERFQNADEWDRNLSGTLGKHGLSAEQHISDMVAEGIDVQVLFPTGLLNSGNMRDPELATALSHAYNDWLHEFCQVDPELFTMLNRAWKPVTDATRKTITGYRQGQQVSDSLGYALELWPRIVSDVENEYVSPEAAASAYGFDGGVD